MLRKVIALGTVLILTLLGSKATPQSLTGHADMGTRVLDVLFPLDVAPEPYFLKMILRFGDSDTQLVVVEYPEGKSEIIRFSVNSSPENLSNVISKMLAENPQVTAQEIAAKFKVDVHRAPIADGVLNHAISELKSIRISPALSNREAVDEYSKFEFWFDTWQESVHYTISGPFRGEPRDELVQWMLKFRASLPNQLKADGTMSLPKTSFELNVPMLSTPRTPSGPRTQRM